MTSEITLIRDEDGLCATINLRPGDTLFIINDTNNIDVRDLLKVSFDIVAKAHVVSLYIHEQAGGRIDPLNAYTTLEAALKARATWGFRRIDRTGSEVAFLSYTWGRSINSEGFASKAYFRK